MYLKLRLDIHFRFFLFFLESMIAMMYWKSYITQLERKMMAMDGRCTTVTALIWFLKLVKQLSLYLKRSLYFQSEIYYSEICFFFLGHKLESLDDCLQFTIKASIDPCLTWDFIVKYYLNASLALW